MVDEHEAAAEAVGEGVDPVVDVGHRAVVVLVAASGHEAVEGVEHDDLEPPWLEGLEVRREREDVLQPPAQVVHEDPLGDLAHRHAPSLGDLRQTVSAGLAV